MVEPLRAVVTQQRYSLAGHHLVRQFQVVLTHRMELDRLEAAIVLRVLQWVVVDDLAVQRLVVFTERRGCGLQTGLFLERGFHPVPGRNSHMVCLIDKEVAAERCQGLQCRLVEVLQRLLHGDNHVGLGQLSDLVSRQTRTDHLHHRVECGGRNVANLPQFFHSNALFDQPGTQRVRGHQHQGPGQPPGDEHPEHGIGFSGPGQHHHRGGRGRRHH